jgi:hypothetical protein
MSVNVSSNAMLTTIERKRDECERNINSMSELISNIKNDINIVQKNNPILKSTKLMNDIIVKYGSKVTPTLDKNNQKSYVLNVYKILIMLYNGEKNMYNTIVDKINNYIRLVQFLNQNIETFALPIGKNLRKDRYILTLLETIHIINNEIQILQDEINNYDSEEKTNDDEYRTNENIFNDTTDTETNKLKQLFFLFKTRLHIKKNTSNKEINGQLIQFLNNNKENELTELSSITNNILNKDIVETISANLKQIPANPVSQVKPSKSIFNVFGTQKTVQSPTQIQVNLLTLLNNYDVLLDEIKNSGAVNNETITKRKEIELRIEQNIELLAETMLTNNIDTKMLNKKIRDRVKKIYKELKYKLDNVYKIETNLIKDLIKLTDNSKKDNKQTIQKKIDDLASTISDEIISKNLNPLDIITINQIISDKLLVDLPFDIVKEVKYKIIGTLKTKIKDYVNKILTNNIKNATGDLVTAEQTGNVDEINFAKDALSNARQEKTDLIINNGIEQSLDNWLKKQTLKIKGLGFSETLEKKPLLKIDRSKMSFSNTCSTIATTKNEINYPHYFPSQFPNLVNKTKT